jgi:hypothetical protein
MPKPRATARTTAPSDPVLHTNLTLIEVAEPDLLDELRADRRLGPMIVAQLSECVAVVKPEDRTRFLQQLFRAGHTPKVIEG